jgi:hypothetical protein
LNDAAAARLHAATKSLHVLTTSRAEFAAAAGSRSRIIYLRNSRKGGKKHRYAEGRTGDPLYHHLGILPAFCRSW